ncbi:hypothetical protein HDU81_004081 [Chytriomyces hyalinus]|nr:hypothetical protein HDU81_004081 [Chytriomyces hyalinus]
MLSTDGQKTWKEIGRDPTCGIQAKNPTGRGSVQVTIPDGTYSAVLRWNWVADNGGAPNEIYNQCADIQVSPSGSNTHAKVEMMGGSVGAGFTALPRGSTFNSGCSQAGALKCAESDKAFINQCISLPAGGGYSGGINWYQYQCPIGATCQTVGGSDKCVGASGPVSPAPGPAPVPAPQPDQPPAPSSSATPNKPATTTNPNKSTQVPVATTAGNPPQGGVSNGASCSTNGGYACASSGAIAVCSGGAWVEMSCPSGSKCGVVAGMTYCL